MDGEEAPKFVLGVFGVLLIALPVGSAVTGWPIRSILTVLSEVFVPLFLLATFVTVVWFVVS